MKGVWGGQRERRKHGEICQGASMTREYTKYIATHMHCMHSLSARSLFSNAFRKRFEIGQVDSALVLMILGCGN
mgnify:CR=1 FL=1